MNKPIKLIYEITPQTADDVKRVIQEIESENGMLPSSIICNENEYLLIQYMKNLDEILQGIFIE